MAGMERNAIMENMSMNKKLYWISGFCVLMAMGLMSANARPIEVDYRLGMRYDDNANQRASSADKEDSLVIFNQLALDLESVTEGGYVGLRYSGAHTWYNDRDNRKSDWDHSLLFRLSRALSPRVSVELSDTFSYVQSPGLVREDGAVLRLDSTYLFNTLSGALSTVVTPSLHLDVSGRHAFLRYEEDELAEREDYDLVAAGLGLRSLVTKESYLIAEARMETQDYKGAGHVHPNVIDYPGSIVGDASQVVPDRGSETLSFGLGVNHMFSPTLIAMVRGGYMVKEFDDANAKDETAPYGEAALTVIPVPSTRVTLSANYTLFQSSLITFANQERLALAMNLEHDLGPKITAYLGASHIESKYESAQSVSTLNPATVEGGTEDAYSVSARLAYRLNRMNSFEFGYTVTDLSSDLREEFTRNRYDLSWNLRF